MVLLHLIAPAEEGRKIALRVEIDAEDAQTTVAPEKTGSDVLDGGGFGYPTLIVGECQDFFNTCHNDLYFSISVAKLIFNFELTK